MYMNVKCISSDQVSSSRLTTEQTGSLAVKIEQKQNLLLDSRLVKWVSNILTESSSSVTFSQVDQNDESRKELQNWTSSLDNSRLCHCDAFQSTAKGSQMFLTYSCYDGYSHFTTSQDIRSIPCSPKTSLCMYLSIKIQLNHIYQNQAYTRKIGTK